MHPVIAKTFGGLSAQYYFRHLVFGVLLSGFFYFMASQGGRSVSAGLMFVLIVNALLYPYSRFVYESVVGFIMGENVFFVNAFFMLFVKLMTMAVCWGAALFIAPLGLAYLYFHHSKAQPQP